jgi:hypothetical protein
VIKDVRFTDLYALVQTEVYSERYAKAPVTEREKCIVSDCLQRLGAVSGLRLAAYTVYELSQREYIVVMCVRQCAYSDTTSEVNLGIKRLIVPRCLTMYGIPIYTTVLTEIGCHMSRADRKVERISYVRNGT